jgi:hypothetical protein
MERSIAYIKNQQLNALNTFDYWLNGNFFSVQAQ